MSKKLAKKKAFVFATFYQFTTIENPAALKSELYTFQEKLLGLIILAEEGINGTIAGSSEHIDSFVNYLQSHDFFQDLQLKYSQTTLQRMPFRRLKIKIKPEIVTFGMSDLNIRKLRGTYVEPKDWNAVITDPEVLVIDARNVYEHRIGTFKGARNPRTLHFRQLPTVIEDIIHREKPQKIALFCTGGIRCEKASAYTKSLGIGTVYQLHGGILKYLETVSPEQSLWTGNCFVFDGRITVDHNLKAKLEPLCKICGQVMLKEPTSHDYVCYQCLEYPGN